MDDKESYARLADELNSLDSDEDEEEEIDLDDYISPADGYFPEGAFGPDVYRGEDVNAADVYDEDEDEDEDDLYDGDDGMDGDNVVLCVSNSYTKQYYFNRQFSNIPKEVQDELKIMCVWFTEECGGILTLEFDDDGNLLIKQTTSEYDGYYDQIGSELKINQMRRERKEFLLSLELYYKVVAMGMSAEELQAALEAE